MKRIFTAFLALFVCSQTYAFSHPGLAQITPAQEQKINSSFKLAGLSPAQLETISSARETISKYVAIESCRTNYKSSSILNKWHEAGSSSPDYYMMIHTEGHDKSICLDVERIHGWRFPTKNKIIFEVLYVSSLAGTSRKQFYILKQQADGEWLFNVRG